MTLDVRTLGFIAAIIPLVLGLIMIIYWRERKTYGGFIQWVLANFVFFAGYMLLALRGIVPDLFSIIVANAIIVYAEILIYQGIRLFRSQPGFSKLNAFILVLFLILQSYFTYLNPNINARIALISICLFVLITRSGLSLVNAPFPKLRRTFRNTGLVFLITAILPLARTLHALSQSQPIDLFTDRLSSWFSVFGIVSFIIWNFYFFLLNSARLELDLEIVRMELMQLAITDPLTGLYNRRHFFERAELEFERAKRLGHNVTFLLMDVDDFKIINDTHGHAAGDEVMKALAGILPSAVRPFDLIARFGGDEFVVMLINTNIDQAHVVAERICSSVAQTLMFSESKTMNIHLSVGIASFNSSDPDLKVILKRADEALYLSKKDGKNSIRAM